MRKSPVPHLFFIGLTVSLPSISWSQTAQNILNNAKQDMIILIMPESMEGKCVVAETTSPDWWKKVSEGCIKLIPNDINWLDPKVLSEVIPKYHEPSEYEFSQIKDGVYKIVPIISAMELPSWTDLVKTSTRILKKFDSPEEKCGKIKNLSNSDPKNPPEVCFPK